MPRRSFESAGDAMRSVIDQMEAGGRIREALALAYWPDAVGEGAAAASAAEEIRDGVLTVRTKSSAWSQELVLLKHRILERLNHRIGRAVVRDLRFRTGYRPVGASDEGERAEPSAADLTGLALLPRESRELAEGLRMIASMSDDHPRERLAAVLEHQYRLRRWRRSAGWRACLMCDTLTPSRDRVCDLCRVLRKA